MFCELHTLWSELQVSFLHFKSLLQLAINNAEKIKLIAFDKLYSVSKWSWSSWNRRQSGESMLDTNPDFLICWIPDEDLFLLPPNMTMCLSAAQMYHHLITGQCCYKLLWESQESHRPDFIYLIPTLLLASSHCLFLEMKISCVSFFIFYDLNP